MADLSEIRAAAAGDVEKVCDALGLTGGLREGIHYKPVNPVRADARPGSFVIDFGGMFPGRWYEFTEARGGDVIDLVSYVQTGGGAYQSRTARGAAIGWLADLFGFERACGRFTEDPSRRAAREADVARRKAEAARRAAREQADKARRAKGWWLSGLPILGEDGQETPVWRYLTQHRQVPLQAFSRLPGAVRYLPGRRPSEALMGCAMARGGDCVAVHLTLLDGHGAPRDVAFGPKRKMWGDKAGAVVRVSKGSVGLSPEAAAKRGKSGPLIVTEGVEDGLILSFLFQEAQVWAAGDLGNCAAVAERGGWPACANEVILVPDNDRDGSAGAALFQEKVVPAWISVCGGRPVRVMRPIGAKDANDVWRAA